MDNTAFDNGVMGKLTRVQVGKAMPYAREKASAIAKQQVNEPVSVGVLGLAGDEQADTFFHGGALQAVHQMPLSVYELLKKQYPKAPAYVGMLGENITIERLDGEVMNEKNVCIGDIYQIGDTETGVKLEVTRPRRPCWKLNIRLRLDDAASFLQDAGQVGWYYRVVQTGQIQVSDDCGLISRPHAFASLERLWQICNDKTFKDAQEINKWLGIEALEQSFKDVLAKRLK